MIGTWITKNTRYKRSTLRAHIEDGCGAIGSRYQVDGKISKNPGKASWSKNNVVTVPRSRIKIRSKKIALEIDDAIAKLYRLPRSIIVTASLSILGVTRDNSDNGIKRPGKSLSH